MDLGERLKLLRKDKGMNQPDVAKILGVSVPAISSYENGTRTPDIDMMVKISELYNISIDNLVERSSCFIDYNSMNILNKKCAYIIVDNF